MRFVFTLRSFFSLSLSHSLDTQKLSKSITLLFLFLPAGCVWHNLSICEILLIQITLLESYCCYTLSGISPFVISNVDPHALAWETNDSSGELAMFWSWRPSCIIIFQYSHTFAVPDLSFPASQPSSSLLSCCLILFFAHVLFMACSFSSLVAVT